MATVVVRNVPEDRAKRIWKAVDFSDVRLSVRRSAVPKPRYWEDPSDPDNESYGPFGGEEAVAFLKGVVVAWR